MPRSVLTLAVLLTVLPAVTADEVERPKNTGSISGRFVFDGTPPVRRPLDIPTTRTTLTGEKFSDPDAERFAKLQLVDETLVVGEDHGLQYVIIWVSDRRIPVAPQPPVRRLLAPATLTFKDGRLTPHVLAWWAEHRMLELKNDDAAPLNLHVQGQRNNFNRLLATGKSVVLNADTERLPTPIKSDIYPWLQPAILLPCAHPYFAVTDKEGFFQIENLPLGEWEFRAWHERCGWIRTADWPKGRFTLRIEPGKRNLDSIKVSPASLESKPDQPARSVSSSKPSSNKSRPGWKELAEQRRAAHEKDGGKEWVGTWTMHLPAGFEHQIRIVESDDGILKLDADKNLNSLGKYAFVKNQLVLVRPHEDSSTDDFIWQLNDEGMFVLITDRNRAGARYIGAVLEKTAR